MFDVLNAFEKLFPRRSSEPAVAAAVTVLASVPFPPLPSDRLEAGLRAVAPHLSDNECIRWISVLSEPMHKAGITVSRRVAAFLGQCSVETSGFQSLEEDLSFSAARLCQVWPNRFPNTESAEACALQPEMLANRIYANRMGNGEEVSGDGWRFRGRGLIQLTGRSAYEHFAQTINMPLDQAVEYAATPGGAANSAIWYWTCNQLNALADTWSVGLITKKLMAA